MKSSLGINVVLSTILILEASAIPFAAVKTQGYPYAQQQWSSQQSNIGLNNNPAQDWTSKTYQQSPSHYPAQVPLYSRPTLGYPLQPTQSTSASASASSSSNSASASSSSSSASASSSTSQQLPYSGQPIGPRGYNPKVKIYDRFLPNSQGTRTIPLPLKSDTAKYKVYELNSGSIDTIPTYLKNPIIKAEAELAKVQNELGDLIHTESFSTQNNNGAAQSSFQALGDTSNLEYKNFGSIKNSAGAFAQGSSYNYPSTASSSSVTSGASGAQSSFSTAQAQDKSLTKQSNSYNYAQSGSTASSSNFGNGFGLAYPSSNNYNVIYGNKAPLRTQQVPGISNSQTTTSTSNGAFDNQNYLNPGNVFTFGSQPIYNPVYTTYTPKNINQGATPTPQATSSSFSTATSNIDQLNGNKNTIPLQQVDSGYTNGAYTGGLYFPIKSYNFNNNAGNPGLLNQAGSSADATAFSSTSTTGNQYGTSYPPIVNFIPTSGSQDSLKVVSFNDQASSITTNNSGSETIIVENDNKNNLPANDYKIPSTDSVTILNSTSVPENIGGISNTNNFNYNPISGNEYTQNTASSSNAQATTISNVGFGKYTYPNYNIGYPFNFGNAGGSLTQPEFSSNTDTTASDKFQLYPWNNPSQLFPYNVQSSATASSSSISPTATPTFLTPENPTNEFNILGDKNNNLPGSSNVESTIYPAPLVFKPYQGSFTIPSQNQLTTGPHESPSDIGSSGSSNGLYFNNGSPDILNHAHEIIPPYSSDILTTNYDKTKYPNNENNLVPNYLPLPNYPYSHNYGIDNKGLPPTSYPVEGTYSVSTANSQASSTTTVTDNTNKIEKGYTYSPEQNKAPNNIPLENTESSNGPNSNNGSKDTLNPSNEVTQPDTSDISGSNEGKPTSPPNESWSAPNGLPPTDSSYPNNYGIGNKDLPNGYSVENTYAGSSANSQAYSTTPTDRYTIKKGYPNRPSVQNEAPEKNSSENDNTNSNKGPDSNNGSKDTLNLTNEVNQPNPDNISGTNDTKPNIHNNENQLHPNYIHLPNYAYPHNYGTDNTGLQPNYSTEITSASSSATSEASSDSTTTDEKHPTEKDFGNTSSYKNKTPSNHHSITSNQESNDDDYYFDYRDDKIIKNSNTATHSHSKHGYNNGYNHGAIRTQPGGINSNNNTKETGNKIHHGTSSADAGSNVKETSTPKPQDNNDYYESYYDDDESEAHSSAISQATASASSTSQSTSTDGGKESSEDEFDVSKSAGALGVLIKIIAHLENLFASQCRTRAC